MVDNINAFHIQGCVPLNGIVSIGGSKNAATPILAATLLTSEPCRLENVPRIQDVESMIEVLRMLGAQATWQDEHTIVIEAKDIKPVITEEARVLMRRMRSSVLFFGPLLARFGEVDLPYPGGCDIGARPIDTHLNAFRDMGYEIREEEKWIKIYKTSHERPSEIILSEFSVTATENILMALALGNGECTIHIAAAEPHVQDLCGFLEAIGVEIKGIGSHDLTVRGAKSLHGANHRIIPDPIETGTFLIAALATKGDVQIQNAAPKHLALILKLLREHGALIEEGDASLHVRSCDVVSLGRVQAMPYPGIPTDLQSLFAVLATQTPGQTLIHDPLYEGRMKVLGELVKLGASVKILDEHRAVIEGGVKLSGANVEGHDLRGTAALVIAAICARGESVVYGVEHIDRGYESIDKKLQGLGAKIERV
ncbi:MAG: UDP-N-acetylglucosamine 1-carboxyvinyltransferase [Candidatus Spechtbacteria bacterium]|nr:UDP-N-acetylglucosamine 1-carboxyvinyltransferase [Candidatus Spechtbacteria bacterium]